MRFPRLPKMDNTFETSTKNDEYTLEDSLPSSEKRGIFQFVLGTLVSVLIITGVVVLGVIYFKIPEQKVVVEVIPTIVVSPTEIPKAVILKNEDITFEILNATGVAGMATKYKTKLEARGYKVNSVAMATEKQKGTNIFMVKNLEIQKEEILKEIKKDIPKLNYAGEMDDSINMVRLVIGY